jgi:PAS domain S-box-containing protein
MKIDERPFEPTEANELLLSIAAGVCVATGEAFFRCLAQQLCTVLKTDFACVSEVLDDNPDSVRVFVLFEGDKFRDEVQHRLSNTPCQQALASGRSSYPQNVQSFFPFDHQLVEMQIEGYLGVALIGSSGQPLGIMSVMSRSPIRDASNAEIILNIFASRAAAELERRRAERALRESDFRNRALLSALPDLICVLDKEGIIYDVYPKYSSAFIIDASARGQKLETILGPEPTKLILETPTLDPRPPAIVEYSLPVLGQSRFYEARTVSFGSDRLLTMIRDITDRKRAEKQLEESRRFARRVEETTPNVLFVYDLIERRNVYSNERSVDVVGYTPKEIEDMGVNFISQLLHPDDIAMLPQLGAEYARRADGEVFEHTLRMRHKNGQWRWVQRSATIFSRTPDGRPRQILGSVADITRFVEAERQLRELSARLLSIQDEERRRIARELHDVTGQSLAAMSFHLMTIHQSDSLDPAARTALSECQKLCEESQKDIRTLSYLLHPPMLDPLGLVRTLEWYIDGLRKRTRIEIVLEVQHDPGRLAIELETDLFRVIQEGLTNVMRHSGSKIAVIRLAKKQDSVLLEIEDQGRGLKAEMTEQVRNTAVGVGIPSMRERLRQHGGTLEISTGIRGTTLTALVPITPGVQDTKTLEKSARI